MPWKCILHGMRAKQKTPLLAVKLRSSLEVTLGIGESQSVLTTRTEKTSSLYILIILRVYQVSPGMSLKIHVLI